MKTKQCSKCKETKPVSGFGKDARRKDGLRCWCKECIRQYRQRPEAKERRRQDNQRPEAKERRRQREQRPEVKERRRQREQRPEAKEYKQQYNRQYFQNLRSQIIQLYGDKCLGCGNPYYGFLEIDHILGGGNQHLKECGGDTYRMYKAILAEGCRPDKYRVLCKACNGLARWYSIEKIQAIFKPVQYLDNPQQIYQKDDYGKPSRHSGKMVGRLSNSSS